MNALGSLAIAHARPVRMQIVETQNSDTLMTTFRDGQSEILRLFASPLNTMTQSVCHQAYRNTAI